jgi:LysM repeat protein
MTFKKPSGVQKIATIESKIKRSPFLKNLVKAYAGLKGKLVSFEKDEINEFRKSFGKFGPHVGLFIIFIFVFISNVLTSYANTQPVKSIVLASLDAKEVKKFTDGVSHYSVAANGTNVNTTELAYQYTQDNYLDTPETVATNKTADVEIKKEPEVPVERKDTIKYTVEAGDTLSGLAKKYGLKIATLQSLNSIGSNGMIKPGQELKIPPKDLTATQLAKNSTNKSRLASTAQASERVVRTNSYNGSRSVEYVSKSAGQCVPFAREYSGKPVYGVAKYIPANSQDPAVGGVMLTSESGYGHVAVVTAINGDTIEIIERNYVSGWITKRQIPRNSSVIRGYFN